MVIYTSDTHPRLRFPSSELSRTFVISRSGLPPLQLLRSPPNAAVLCYPYRNSCHTLIAMTFCCDDSTCQIVFSTSFLLCPPFRHFCFLSPSFQTYMGRFTCWRLCSLNCSKFHLKVLHIFSSNIAGLNGQFKKQTNLNQNDHLSSSTIILYSIRTFFFIT